MKKVLKALSLILCVCLILSVFCVSVSADTVYNGRNDFLWGVSIHPASYSDYSLDPELYVKYVAETGAKTIRVNIGENINDFTYIDRIAALCSSYNLKIIACAALSDDLDHNREYYRALSGRFDGKSGHGFIDYIEIGGEEEVPLLNKKYPINGPAGDSITHYDMSDVMTLMDKYASAIEGIKESGSNIKTVIDFSHLHYAPLLYMYQNGLDFDVIGIDWYTNMGSINNILTPVINSFPHDIIITETNLWSNSDTDFENLNEYSTLFEFMNAAYNESRVKGLVFYELVDETIFEGAGTFNTEAHFGLLYSVNENTIAPKPVYTYLQSVLGGGTVTPEPVLKKEISALLDLGGIHTSFADAPYWFYHYLSDAHCKENTDPADFSNSQFIEFDLKIGDYNAFLNEIDSKGLSLWFRLSSGDRIYNNSTAVSFSLQSLEPLGNGWYHFKMPRENFGRFENGSVDWSSIKNWQFFIEGGNEYEVGSLYSMDFYFRNICGSSPAGSLPENTICVIDKEGIFNTLGSYYADVYSRFCKAGLNSADLTDAEYIEFDMYFSDYESLEAVAAANGIRMDFSLTSSNELWGTRFVTPDIFRYAVYSDYGWYHFKIPKTAFVYAGGGANIDWKNVNTWLITFENSAGIPTAENADIAINIKNICATGSPLPALPENAITLDKYGKTATIGAYYHYFWDRLNAKRETTDLTYADYIEFDIKYSDYSAVRSTVSAKGYQLCINFTSSGSAWNNRSFSPDIFNCETALSGGWYHYKIPKALFTGDIKWNAVNFWMFGFNGSSPSSPVAAGNLADASITVSNICGTVYKLVSDKYTVSDGYVNIPDNVEVKELSDSFLFGAKVYNGTQSVKSGSAANGMTLEFSVNGTVYDRATVIVNNDIYADGYVNSLDLVLLRKYLFGLKTLTPIQKIALTGEASAEPNIINIIKMKKEIIHNKRRS